MDGQHPFDLPDDFPFAEMGRDYATGNFSIQEIATEYNISRDTFLAIRRAAPQTWTQEPPNLWWDDLDKGAEELAQEAADRAKAAEATKKARQRKKREDKKAARKWYRLESAIEEATAQLQADGYEPPKATLRVGSDRHLDPAAVVFNGQDLHIGKRPEDAEEDYGRRYIEALKDAFRSGLEKAIRAYNVETLYLITGGDLIHVDNFQEATTSGTPQDTLFGPTEALQQAIGLLRWMVDYARSCGIEVHIVTVVGNHDLVLGQAAGIALQQRFAEAEAVVCHEPEYRVYFQYGRHLILATHGDMKKRQWRKLPSLMMKEARDLLASTEFQTVLSGHLHFQASDLEDESGTLFTQGSSPSPVDEWHHREGYAGSRRGMQLLTIEPESAATTVRHEPVTV